MEYHILYETWKKEKESSELQPLHKHFYAEASALVRSQHDESQMLDEKSLRAQLLAKQQSRSQRLLANLVEIRFKKICNIMLNGDQLNKDLLTSEEESFADGLSSAKEKVGSLLRSVVSGRPPHVTKTRIDEKPKRVMVRFLQDIPSIVGSNAQIYGPFKTEDIATLPAENAESLIKRGVALRVEVQ